MTKVALTVALIASLALAFSCGGSKERLPPERYFTELERLLADVDDRVTTLGEGTFGQLPEGASEQEQIDNDRYFYNGYLDIVNDFLEGTGDLRPPKDAEAVHDEFLAAGRDFADALETITDGLQSVTTVAEVDALFTQDVSDSEERLMQACVSAQEIADNKSVDVDLNCDRVE